MQFTNTALLLSALTIPISAAPISSALAHLLPRQQTCYSGVYMIVGRGSTQAPGEGSPGAVADAVAAQLPDSASVAVDYPASLLDPPYPESVVDGINDMESKIKAYVDACGSDSKIALIGYSQGGNLATDTLAGGVDKPDPISTSYSKYITAVTVFGDPSFTVGQSFDVGTATKSGVFAREPGGASLALLNTYADIIQSYCNANDEFCASGDSGDVHGSEVEDFTSAATAFIVAKNS
ncbi:MAG: hypothetical protein M1828_003317 [Chrysothrix sp. TS-e1954]|nr:MAG: hypothetical protein M1828_003317 [Chrysothrix sp. TS-e1954]